MKKLIPLLLITFLMFILAACGEKQGSDNTENAKTAMIVLDDRSEKISKNDVAFSMALAGNTSLQNKMNLSEDCRYWQIRVENTGKGKIVIEVGGVVHTVEAEETVIIYSTEQWEAGTYSVSFASIDTMQGNVICFVADTLNEVNS